MLPLACSTPLIAADDDPVFSPVEVYVPSEVDLYATLCSYAKINYTMIIALWSRQEQLLEYKCSIYISLLLVCVFLIDSVV